MDKNVKYCPLIKDKCLDKSCMWYVTGIKECAVNVLAQAADCQVEIISNAIEDMNHEN